MSNYQYEFSRFPENLYTMHHFKNVCDAPAEVTTAIALIKDAMMSGAYDKASRLLAENRAIVSDYWIDADIINAIEEEIHNLEVHTKKSGQFQYYSDKEPNGTEGDVWIG